MLGALEESIETQRRFVADASHELRTPLTSLQTNIEVLKQQERLDPEQRARLFADLEREAHEMRDLITGLLELARGDANLERTTGAARRARRDRRRARARRASRTCTSTRTSSRRRSRACPSGSSARSGTCSRTPASGRTHGSSVDVTPRERRAARARPRPGHRRRGPRARLRPLLPRRRRRARCPAPGLGLAIVREVAEAHGGSVSAEEAPGGGALLRLRFAQFLEPVSSAADSMSGLHRTLPTTGGSSVARRRSLPWGGAGLTASSRERLERLVRVEPDDPRRRPRSRPARRG